jgi:hypothetical protein
MFGTFAARRKEAMQIEQIRQREMTHSERMKALETGQPLPEVEIAKTQAETVKAQMEAAKAIAATIGRVLVPLGMGGIGIGMSAVVICNAPSSLHLAALSIIWVCVAVVGTASAVSGWIEKQRWDLRSVIPGWTEHPPRPDDSFRHSIQE